MDLPAEQQQALDRAIDAHNSGNLDEAARLYRELLHDFPEQADALHYLGVISLQSGRFDEAVDLIRQAVDARPDDVDAIINLGYGLNALGHFEAAVEQFERALAIGPRTATLLSNLGASLEQLRRYPDAVQSFEAALALQPELAEARRSLADTFLKMGRKEDALREITRAVSAGRPSFAMQVSLANILCASGRTDDAIRRFKQVLKARPDALEVRDSLAKVLRDAGKSAEAAEQYEKMLKQDPDNVDGHYNLGTAYQDLNQKNQALAAFRRAVKLDVTCAKAWHGISAVSKNAFDDSDINTILDMQKDTNAAPEPRMLLAFALGRHFEISGQHDDAATQYLMANQITRAELDYDINDDLRTYNHLQARFDRAFLNKWGESGLPDKAPIFIVGMPRSGTTLVEQILASHPRVFGGGELTLLTDSIVATFPITGSSGYVDALDETSAAKLQAVANNYLGHLPSTDADYITDKLPHNFLNVGMIRILFPNASIVHCRRDPRDTCFSIFKNLFGTHAYTFDLEELARYYNAYSALMDHWNDVMPGVIHTVEYETMIDEQEQTTRELLDACGLEWDPACLDFHKHKRPIATISVSQVRQPIYRGSIEAWKPYEKMLKPLLEILER